MTKLSKHEAGLLLLLALSLIVGWRPLIDTFTLSLSNDEYTHILLILPISATLIFLEWRFLRTKVEFSIRTGSAFLVTAVAIACTAVLCSASLPTDVQLSIKMFALVFGWIGAFVLCLGPAASRTVFFPLCFLFGLVPLPNVLMDGIVTLLQQGSAWSSRVLFVATGVPVTQDGNLLTIPGLTLLVAQECSSIRSSSMLLVTTMVLAQLLLRSPWRKHC